MPTTTTHTAHSMVECERIDRSFVLVRLRSDQRNPDQVKEALNSCSDATSVVVIAEVGDLQLEEQYRLQQAVIDAGAIFDPQTGSTDDSVNAALEEWRHRLRAAGKLKRSESLPTKFEPIDANRTDEINGLDWDDESFDALKGNMKAKPDNSVVF